LRDELHHGWRKIGIGVDRHALEGNRARDDDEHCDHQDDKALLQRKLDDAVDHREAFQREARRSKASCGVARKWLLVLQGILELEEQAAVADDALAFLKAVLNQRAAILAVASFDETSRELIGT
jgi:hypothetical protein